jgi:vesicle transport protein SEC22
MVVTTFIARVVDGLILCESWDSGDGGGMSDSQNQKNKAKMLLKKLQNTDPKCSVESGSCVFHYMIDNGVVYLVLADRAYPKAMAFRFLEDIKNLFIQHLVSDWGQGVDLRSKIETIDKPYHFIRFDRTIAKKKQEYRDPQASGSMQKFDKSHDEMFLNFFSKRCNYCKSFKSMIN